jgi:hypothetical protein
VQDAVRAHVNALGGVPLTCLERDRPHVTVLKHPNGAACHLPATCVHSAHARLLCPLPADRRTALVKELSAFVVANHPYEVRRCCSTHCGSSLGRHLCVQLLQVAAHSALQSVPSAMP